MSLSSTSSFWMSCCKRTRKMCLPLRPGSASSALIASILTDFPLMRLMTSRWRRWLCPVNRTRDGLGVEGPDDMACGSSARLGGPEQSKREEG